MKATSIYWVIFLAACSSSNITATAFSPGDPGDPVQIHAAALGSGLTQITLTNTSAYDWTFGVVTLAPIFTVANPAPLPLAAFSHRDSPVAGHPTVLITGMGLSEGTNAWVFPPLAQGATATITVPANGPFSFVAHAISSLDDFVGFNDAPVPVTGGTLTGYDLNSANGNIVNWANEVGGWPGTVGLAEGNPCSGAPMTSDQSLLALTMDPTGDPSWPATPTSGEFSGDWSTDGTARVSTPLPSQPAVTGMFWIVDVCPTATASVRVSAHMDTTGLADHDSVATLVVYFFDAGGNALRIDAGYALHRPNVRVEILEGDIPAGTRRIAVAPMANISASETGTPRFDDVTLDYIASAPASSTFASDDFSSYDASNNATGWSESGGDWLVDPANNHAVLWNPAWSSGALPITATFSKTFPLPAAATMSASLYAAATFADPASSVTWRLRFSDGTTTNGEALTGSNFNFLRFSHAAIPPGATDVTVEVETTLGAYESSSLSVDNLVLSTP